MDSIQPNYPIRGTQSTPANLGDTPGSIDNDPAFAQLGDAIWEALSECKANPNDLNVQTAMQTVNNLMAYFASNMPTQANNPTAFAVYQTLTSKPSGGKSLAEDCADYGTTNCQGTVQWFQSQPFDSGPFASLYAETQKFPNAFKDQGKTDIKTDISNLDSSIQVYNWYMAQKNPDPKLLNSLLVDIAGNIEQLAKDFKADGITDGYLTTINTFIHTPVQTTPSGQPVSLSLEQLSANLLAHSPPAQADLDAFQQALKGLGEASGDSGGSFRALIELSIKEEYPS